MRLHNLVGAIRTTHEYLAAVTAPVILEHSAPYQIVRLLFLTNNNLSTIPTRPLEIQLDSVFPVQN